MNPKDYEKLRARMQPNGNSDPRKVGNTHLTRDPFHSDQAVLDTTDTVLVDHFQLAAIEAFADATAKPMQVYITIGGRINKSRDRVQLGCIFPIPGAASLLVELLAFAETAGPAVMAFVASDLAEAHDAGKVHLDYLAHVIDLAKQYTNGQTPG